MQVTAANATLATAAQPVAVTSVRVLAGNVTSIPLGTLLQATVTQVSQGQAVIVVNGQALTVRPAGTLQPGTILLVRAPSGNGTSTPALELVGGSVPPSTQQLATAGQSSPTILSSSTATTTSTTVSASQNANAAVQTSQAVAQTTTAATSNTLPLVRVDVLAVLPNGQVRVQINGQDDIATTTEQLVAGEKYVLQVERTPTGLMLSSAPDTPDLPSTLAAAILREGSPPDLGAALKPLLAELANLQTTQSPSAVGSQASVQNAANTVRDVLSSFLPASGRPLDATQLQNLIADGGLHFEAKLARLVSEGGQNQSDGDATSTFNGGATSRSDSGGNPDLKEALLRLLQAAQEFGNSLDLSATRSTLDGIESQQAANVFAQSEGTPYILQVPFPDGGQWKTLHLAIEPDGNRRQGSGTSNGFRMLMHVPLTDLGETWIDAGLSGNNLRAVLYLKGQAVREQVRAELPSLKEELLTSGFSEVLLDVRPASELPAQQRKQAAAMQSGRPSSGSVLDVRA